MALLCIATLVPLLDVNITPRVNASPDPESATATPTRYWGPFSSTSSDVQMGDVQINVNRTGIAVRVEVPREFLDGVITQENDTHFVVSDIRNDYFYYSVVDESTHWSYAWNGTDSDAPCYKPDFSIYDPNAPWCVEIWNYLNGTFANFTAPKFVRFVGLHSPKVAGPYNFTLFVADHTNQLGLPDFLHAYNETFVVPVSMVDNPASISGIICDADDYSLPNICSAHPILAKGVVYGSNIDTGQVARTYVNQTNGFFNLTGLAPGSYLIQGSAGIFHGVAYALSRTDCPAPGGDGCYATATVGRGDRVVQDLRLVRSPQVCGTIDYRDSLTQNGLAHSLSDHPYLETAGIQHLNITVEAVDPLALWRQPYRFQSTSLDGPTDTYTVITGQGSKYPGLDPYGIPDPYGTEFAGLPSGSAYSLNLNFYVTGYLQSAPITVNVPANTAHGICINSNAILQSGGVITGTIQLLSTPPTGIANLETPEQAEVNLGLTPTDAIFGGNILISAFDHNGARRGIVVLNGTLPDGRTCYASPALSSLCRIKILGPATIQFYIIGFSEFYNRTWSGWWGQKDYGLPDDEGYNINVQIRGYEQYTTASIPVFLGSNQTLSIRMVRGGAIEFGVYSYDNRPGTRAIQAQMPFRFAAGLPGGFTIAPRARVYIYDSAHVPVGYVDRLIEVGFPCVPSPSPLLCGLDRPNYFQGIFAGQNWNLREIWFFGSQPPRLTSQLNSHLTDDNYTVNGYTLGYVQQGTVSTPMTLGGFARVQLILFLGNEIDLTSPIFFEPSLFGMILEHDHATAETLTGGLLEGAVNANLTAGIATLDFPIFGFGAMIQDRTLNGQGHFFYVSGDGTRLQDYGLDVGLYTTQLPEFGFNRHFISLATQVTGFDDLFLEQGIFLSLLSMARIVNAASLVQGWIANNFGQVIPLSWVTVEAQNGTIDVKVPTLDGSFDGVGAINLPAGIYNITFSVANYAPQTLQNYAVYWNGIYPVLPPFQYLCPLADTSSCPAGSFAISPGINLTSTSQLAIAQSMQPPASTFPRPFSVPIDRGFEQESA